MRAPLFALAAAALVGCGHRPPAGPDETVRAFAAAASAGRIDDAYALMSAEYKKTHDRDAFARSLQPSERRALGRLGAGAVRLRAEVELADGERLSLVEDPEGWRFARDPLELYPQRAADEALRSFVRAVERHRWDVVIRFIPNKYRATLTPESLQKSWEGERKQELGAQLLAVKAHLDDPLDLSGDEARLPLGERKQAKLVREEGTWKVESLE